MNVLFPTVAILAQGTYWANASLQAFRAWVRFAVFNSSVETKGDLCRGGFFFAGRKREPITDRFFGKRATCETNVLQQKVVTVRSAFFGKRAACETNVLQQKVVTVRSGPVGRNTDVIVIGDLRSQQHRE